MSKREVIASCLQCYGSHNGFRLAEPKRNRWADGLDVKAGLEDTKTALLVMIGVLTNGQKLVLAVESGQRESKESWG